ncbi:hypothetical protein Aple_092020 [Acrocarpospora pleiomorpha]|uniref:Uncharacterized protein n=2 Tax=Acrocarpospora pleiomorpha TaxID=90975 RepID=A0A5M3Y335_9ACTN|nr:hypothetical protein Aple_092020 [Acrocarpospora pleiomorpha]
MDPTVIAALLSALAGGVAGEVGKTAWTSLTSLVRRRFGDNSRELAAVEATSPETAPDISDLLVEWAHTDADFGEALTSWAAQTAENIGQSHDVTNTISGNARIQGPVIQAGDVFGSITLGPH